MVCLQKASPNRLARGGLVFGRRRGASGVFSSAFARPPRTPVGKPASHARLARPLRTPVGKPASHARLFKKMSASPLSGTFSPKTDIFKAFLTALMATRGQKACSCMTKAASAPEFVLAGGRNRQFCGGCGDQRCWVLATLIDLRRSTVACSTSAAWPLPASVERSRRPARRVRQGAAQRGRVRQGAALRGRVWQGACCASPCPLQLRSS